MSREVTANVTGEVSVQVPDHITEPEDIREFIARRAHTARVVGLEPDDVDELWGEDGELLAGEGDR